MPKGKNVPIKYTSRDFGSIKDDLVQHAKRFYPDQVADFTQASFNSMILDSVAYVGDVLSYYLDYSVNESFLDTAIEFGNLNSFAIILIVSILTSLICQLHLFIENKRLTYKPNSVFR